MSLVGALPPRGTFITVDGFRAADISEPFLHEARALCGGRARQEQADLAAPLAIGAQGLAVGAATGRRAPCPPRFARVRDVCLDLGAPRATLLRPVLPAVLNVRRPPSSLDP